MLWTCRVDGQYPGLVADYQTRLGIKQFELRLGYVYGRIKGRELLCDVCAAFTSWKRTRVKTIDVGHCCSCL